MPYTMPMPTTFLPLVSHRENSGTFSLESVLRSIWFRKRQIFKPAQNLSKLNMPFGGVTFLKLSNTPLGSPLDPSSCHRASVRYPKNWRLSNETSNKLCSNCKNKY